MMYKTDVRAIKLCHKYVSTITTEDSYYKTCRTVLKETNLDNKVVEKLLNVFKPLSIRSNIESTLYFFSSKSFKEFEILGSREYSDEDVCLIFNLIYTDDSNFTEDDIPMCKRNMESKYNTDKVYVLRLVHKNTIKGKKEEDIVIYVPERLLC